MTNQEQMITPPQLVEQWIDMLSSRSDYAVFSLAAQWGWDQHRAATESELQQAADQELDACCKYMQHEDFHGFATELRAARRPKPTSLKEQALAALEHLALIPDPPGFIADMDTIRRALETLPANELENISYGTYRCSLED